MFFRCEILPPFTASVLVAVGHPEQPLPDVRRTDARSAQIGGPNGISHRFQVSAYNGEPLPSSLARNLFSKDNWRAALGDKSVEFWPQVPFIFDAFSFARDAERLTWAASSPNGNIIWPLGKLQGVGPSANSCKKVALVESIDFIWQNVLD
jgi:hypothetical protein